MADGYISEIKLPDNKVYLLKDSEKGYKWNAITQGQKWSRICLITPTIGIEGSSGILSVSCTRGNVVCNATFLITTSHSNRCFINTLGTTNYIAVRIRGVVTSNGTAYIELYDTAQGIASGTAQTWHCSYIPILSSTLTTYTAFTDGTTVPSGYTAANDFTAPQGDNSAPIVSISRDSGTTFTATRSNGTTFTFTQQDSDTKSFTITANATDGLWDLTGTNGTNAVTYSLAPYSAKGAAASFYTAATNPTLTTRLNYDGYLYATKLYSGGSEVLTAHRTYTAFTGKPTGNQTPGFGDTFTIQQISQSTTGQVSGTDRTVTIPATEASTSTVGLVGTDAQTFGGTKTFNGGMHIYGSVSMSGTTVTNMYSGGAYHAGHNSLVLHGDSAGVSGIGFTSQKAADSGNAANINGPSDRAFIQYHAYGVTAAAEGTAPTLATSGELGTLVIGVGNDATDTIRLQAPGNAGILHQIGATAYPIPHTTNTNGSVGGTTTPVYVEAGVIKAGTALGTASQKAESYFVKAITSTDNAIVRFDGTSGQVQNSGVTIDDNNHIIIGAAQSIYQNQANTSNYTALITWRKNSTGWIKEETTYYAYQPQIGQHNTGGDGTGSIAILPYPTDAAPWGGTVGLFVRKGQMSLDNNRIPHTGNTTGTVGGTTTPIYVDGGQIKALSYTIAKSVPSDAVFTDHYAWSDITSKPATATRWPAWSEITSKPTTLSGYGITDAKIASGVITLGSNTITPITSIADLTGSTITATNLRTNLGLSAALRFIGKATTDMSESTNTAPTVTGVTNYAPEVGDVVLDKNSDAEYVCIAKATANNTTTYTWELLGRSGSWATSTHTHGNITNGGLLGAASVAVVTDGSKKITTADLSVSDPTAATTTSTTFIDTISQSAQGKITATKKTLPSASSSVAGIVKLGASGGAATYGHDHDSVYLKLDGSNNMTADVNIIAGDTDKFINFWYNTGKTAGASWRTGMLGSGSSDTNYFVIQSGTSTTSATAWNNVLQIGQNTYNAGFGGNVYPLTNNSKTLGTSSLKWNNVYATTFTGNLTGNATSADSAKWLMNRGGSTVTISDGPWAHGQTGSGGTNAATVWHQRWKQSGLTYTPSGGSATTLTDSGDMVLWLAQSATSNALTVNMAIDGIIYAMGGFKGNLTGNASTATKSGVTGIWLYPENNNELNFGGTNNSTTIFIGYRTKDSRPIPTKFIFGSSTGTADLQAKTVYLGSGTSSYISSTQYTGNADTATTATYLSNIGRQTNMDIDFGTTTYNSKVFLSYADGSTTTHKPPSNAMVFNVAWDNVNNNHYGGQIAMSNSNDTTLYLRGCNNGTWDNSWKTILDSSNYTTYAVAKTAGVTAVTWDITNKKLTRTINGTAADVMTAAQMSTALGLGTIASEAENSYMKFGGDDTGLGTHSPAATAKSYWADADKVSDNMITGYYNHSGNEYSFLFSKRATYGTILKWGYADRYLRILRIQGGSWKSTDWEKIDAGYADSAGSAKYITLYEARDTTITLNKTANYVAAGAMFHLVASSSTSAEENGKTPTDANVLQMNWDNNGGYDAQIAVSTYSNRMYFRDQPHSKKAWQEVAHAPVSSSNLGSITQPVYMTSDGVLTVCTDYASASVNYATSAGSATSATTASKLGSTDIGDSETLIYLDNGTATAGNKVFTIQGGTSIPSNTNMNSYKTIGNYYCSADSYAKTITNSPFGANASNSHLSFTLKVEASLGAGTQYLRQYWRGYNSGVEAERTSTNSGSSWGSWRTKVFKNSNAATAEGSSKQPVYVSATGAVAAIDYTIEKSVPSDAVFTDHHAWTDITGKPTKITLTGAVTGSVSLGEGDLSLATTVNHNHDSVYVKKVTSTDNAIPRFDGTDGQIQDSTAIINDAGTMTINGKLVVNPSYDTTANAYNEGIRINVASNGWANIHFGGSNDSTSNTGDGQWLVGRRGAVGSTFGAVGDFTIEEEGSTGKGLTLHKDSGGMVLYTSLVQDKPQLKINNAGTIAAGKFGWAINAVSTMAATSNSLLLVGAASSAKNQAYLGFHYEGSGSNSNYLTLGFYGVDHLLTIYPTGQTKITKNITSSSTTTGSLIVAGGVGIGEKLYVADEAHAEKYIIDEHVTLQYNSTDSSLEFVFA